jgi:hypothetical protein
MPEKEGLSGSDPFLPLCSPFPLCPLWFNVANLYFLRTAWAAARRAMGRRYGEQDT